MYGALMLVGVPRNVETFLGLAATLGPPKHTHLLCVFTGAQAVTPAPIALVMKNCLAGVASCAKMINGIFKLHPQRRRHPSRIAGAIANVTCLDLPILPCRFVGRFNALFKSRVSK
jgi:hypothetical protein